MAEPKLKQKTHIIKSPNKQIAFREPSHKTTEDILLRTQLHPLLKYNTNLQNNLDLFNANPIRPQFMRAKTIQQKSKSTSSLNRYKTRDTLKYIIDNGVQFNLSEIIKLGEEGTLYSKHSSRLIRYNIALAIVLSINVVLAIIENQLYILNTIEYISLYGFNESLHYRPISIGENALLTFNLFLSITAAVIVIAIYNIKMYLLQIDKIYSKESTILSSPTLIKRIVIRLIIVLILYPPGVNGLIINISPNTDTNTNTNALQVSYLYSWNGIISCISLLKLIFVFESLNSLSIYTSTIARTVCRNYNAKLDTKFIFKFNMKAYPFFCLIIFSFFLLIILSFIILNFEFATISNRGEYITLFQQWQNVLWFISATMETIAFGDIKPMTHMGYALSFISGILGYSILTLFLIAISVYSEFTFDETKAFYKLKSLLSEENLEKKAMNIIRVTFGIRLNMIMRNKAKSIAKANNAKGNTDVNGKEERKERLMKIFALVCHLKLFISSFHNEYQISRSWSKPVDDYLRNLENNCINDLAFLQREMKAFNGIDSDLKTVERNQVAIEEHMKKISSMQNAIGNYIIQLNNENILSKYKDRDRDTSSCSNNARKFRGYSIESEMASNQTISNESGVEYIKEENAEREGDGEGEGLGEGEEENEYCNISRPKVNRVRRSLFCNNNNIGNGNGDDHI